MCIYIYIHTCVYIIEHRLEKENEQCILVCLYSIPITNCTLNFGLVTFHADLSYQLQWHSGNFIYITVAKNIGHGPFTDEQCSKSLYCTIIIPNILNWVVNSTIITNQQIFFFCSNDLAIDNESVEYL